MNCENTIKHLEDYLEADLSADEKQAVERHLEQCAACRGELDALQALRAQLADLPVPRMPAGTFERMLENASRRAAPAAPQTHRFAPSPRVLATAAAVLLAVGIALGLHLADRQAALAPQVTLTAQILQIGPTEEPVGLMFRSAAMLHDATIAVWLPDDVHISGRPNVHYLSWHTDLKAGANLLELPLYATGNHGGTIVVRLTQGAFVKILEIPIVSRALDVGAAISPIGPIAAT